MKDNMSEKLVCSVAFGTKEGIETWQVLFTTKKEMHLAQNGLILSTLKVWGGWRSNETWLFEKGGKLY